MDKKSGFHRLGVILLLHFFCLFASFSAEAQLSVGKVSVENVSLEEQKMVKRVFGLGEGEPYTEERLQKGLSFLRKWNKFRSVTARLDRKDSRTVDVVLVLESGLFISGIEIHGTYPYLSSRILRVLSVHAGDVYDVNVASAQTGKIEQFYERQGFGGTRVIFEKREKPNGTVDLSYRIRKGKRHFVGTVDVEGNKAFPDDFFRRKLTSFFAYKPARLRKKMDELKKRYLEKGYLNARVRLDTVTFNEMTKKFDVHVKVVEGPRFAVHIRGTSLVSERFLRRNLSMLQEGGFGEYEIEQTVLEIRKYYKRYGFEHVEVRTTHLKHPAPDEEVSETIVFDLHEGPRVRVKKIRFSGLPEEMKVKKIKQKLLSQEHGLFQKGPYRNGFVDSDEKKLPRILKQQGFHEATLGKAQRRFNPSKDQVEIEFPIVAGRLVLVKKILLKGNLFFTERQLRKRILQKEGTPLNEELVTKSREELVRLYANSGHPYVQVEVGTEMQEEGVVLVVGIDPGEEVRIGEVLITGNERTSVRSLRKSLYIRSGDLFDYEAIVESESFLRRFGAFRSVNIETIGLVEKKREVHLLVKVEEIKKIQVDLGFTYDTDDHFTGDMTLTHSNLFNSTRMGVMRFKGGRDLQNGELILRDPNFFSLHLETVVNAKLERKNRPAFKTVEGSGGVSLVKELTPRMTLLNRYEITRTFFSDVVDASGTAEEDHTTSKFSSSMSYDKRDSFSDPRKGFFFFAGTDFSTKLIASGFNYIQPKMHFVHYLSLGRRLTFFNFFQGEAIKVFGGTGLPRDRKLFLGGAYSVRGFSEDAVGPVGSDARPAGGLLSLYHSFETQLRLVLNLKIAGFVDSGSITDGVSAVSRQSIRHGAGIGLRYVTPVGPLRLDYGFKLDPLPGEALGQLHFAFGYAF